ncbi:hypothetical protein JR316_0009344 [Psilocybe cubensis]|uniref:Uncharacterized protein n=2 Tax=Psilocybe cubensis TaxID=181762 RepID=A0ACB8GTX6_PSICU|nr:hypothetical protein JR316_0009344 [Psilocybe cubensis]KAH9478882.1 hypothetical protein JR316_0009344 [Psilocybe cubensis]
MPNPRHLACKDLGLPRCHLRLRAVTIRGTTRKVGDALSAISKRIARCRIRNPRSKKPKQPPAPTATPPTLVVEPPSPTPTSSSTPTTQTSRSGMAFPHSPTPTAINTRSSLSLSLAPGLPMEVDALRAPQQHSDGYSRLGPIQPREGIQTARRGGGPPRVFGANRPRCHMSSTLVREVVTLVSMYI